MVLLVLYCTFHATLVSVPIVLKYCLDGAVNKRTVTVVPPFIPVYFNPIYHDHLIMKYNICSVKLLDSVWCMSRISEFSSNLLELNHWKKHWKFFWVFCPPAVSQLSVRLEWSWLLVAIAVFGNALTIVAIASCSAWACVHCSSSPFSKLTSSHSFGIAIKSKL